VTKEGKYAYASKFWFLTITSNNSVEEWEGSRSAKSKRNGSEIRNNDIFKEIGKFKGKGRYSKYI
jgi:hypothetical protein